MSDIYEIWYRIGVERSYFMYTGPFIVPFIVLCSNGVYLPLQTSVTFVSSKYG